MSKLCMRISMSLDGYMAGPNQSVNDPLGVGGRRLHEWAFKLAAFRKMHGMEGGEVDESTPIVENLFADIGATVMGRNMFGGHPGGWDPKSPWTGWWGSNPPYHHPVFVITHHARPPLPMEGGTTFHFVTGGIEQALELARKAAGGKNVSLGGGASVARQYLAAALVDEMRISLVPTLIGSGERPLDGIGTDLHGLELVQTISARDVTHLVLARK
jgi:dihydrofolate reductase